MIAYLMALMVVGGPALSPDLSMGVVSVGGAVVYHEDPTGQLDLQAIVELEQRGAFQLVESGEPSFGFSDSAYWLHWRLAVPEQPTPLLLEVGHPLLDEVDIYLQEAGVGVNTWQLGRRYEFRFRPIRHRYYVVPLPADWQKPLDVYVRIQSSELLHVPVRLWQRDAFWRAEQGEVLFQALFVGLILVLALYNAFVFLNTRDRVYLYFVLLVTSVGTTLCALNGVGYQFLWGAAPSWQWGSGPILLSFVASFLALFTRGYLELDTQGQGAGPLLDGIFKVALLVGLGHLVALLADVEILARSISMMTAGGLVGLASAVSLFAGIRQSRRAQRHAKVFVKAWVVCLGTIALWVAVELQQGDITAALVHGLEIGSGLQLLMLSYAIGYRLNRLEEHKKSLQGANLNLRQSLTTRLDAKLQMLERIGHNLDRPVRGLIDHNLALADSRILGEHAVREGELGTELDESMSRVQSILLRRFESTRRLSAELSGHVQDIARIAAEMRGEELDSELGELGVDVEELIDAARLHIRDHLEEHEFERVEPQVLVASEASARRFSGNPYVIIHAMDAILLFVWTRALDSSMPQVAIEQVQIDEQLSIRVSCNGDGLSADDLVQLFDGREPPQSKGVPNLGVARSMLRQEGGDLELIDAGDEDGWFTLQLRLVPVLSAEPAYRLGEVHDA